METNELTLRLCCLSVSHGHVQMPFYPDDEHERIREMLEECEALDIVLQALSRVLGDASLDCNNPKYFRNYRTRISTQWDSAAEEVNRQLQGRQLPEVTGELCKRLHQEAAKKARDNKSYHARKEAAKPQPPIVSPGPTVPPSMAPAASFVSPSPRPSQPFTTETGSTTIQQDSAGYATPHQAKLEVLRMEFANNQMYDKSHDRRKTERSEARGNLMTIVDKIGLMDEQAEQDHKEQKARLANFSVNVASLARQLGVENPSSVPGPDPTVLFPPENETETENANVQEPRTLFTEFVEDEEPEPESKESGGFGEDEKVEEELDEPVKYLHVPMDKSDKENLFMFEFQDVPGDGHCFYHSASKSGSFRKTTRGGHKRNMSHLDIRGQLRDFLHTDEGRRALYAYCRYIEQGRNEQFQGTLDNALENLSPAHDHSRSAPDTPLYLIGLLCYFSRKPIYVVMDSTAGFDVLNVHELVDQFVEAGKQDGLVFPRHDAQPWMQEDSVVVYHHCMNKPANPTAHKNHYANLKYIPDKATVEHILAYERVYLGGGCWWRV